HYYVGSNYVFDALHIQNGGVLTTIGEGFLGYAAGPHSNVVRVSGAGSTWNTSGGQFGMVVGYSGAGNRLVISNGGRVFNGGANGEIGLLSSNNNVLVTGSGSIW